MPSNEAARRHLAKVPFESFQMPREALLTSDVQDMNYVCRCGKTHAWSVQDGRLVVDGVDVTDV